MPLELCPKATAIDLIELSLNSHKFQQKMVSQHLTAFESKPQVQALCMSSSTPSLFPPFAPVTLFTISTKHRPEEQSTIVPSAAPTLAARFLLRPRCCTVTFRRPCWGSWRRIPWTTSCSSCTPRTWMDLSSLGPSGSSAWRGLLRRPGSAES